MPGQLIDKRRPLKAINRRFSRLLSLPTVDNLLNDMQLDNGG